MKRINFDVDDQKHRDFKIKAVSVDMSMGEILEAAIDDYLAGKWKPTKRPAPKPGNKKAA